MQKSKVTWLKLGDGNKAYFHATVKGKNGKAGIYSLETNERRVLTNFADIEDEVLHFYTQLVGTCDGISRGIDVEALRNGKQLGRMHGDSRIRPVTDKEIWEALKSIGEAKAPGIDGFNSKFFKVAWNIVKTDLINVVQEFFGSEWLYKAVNCTLVTLIQKSSTAKTMKDMKPISCCTTVYKIISKVLTMRLSKVINEVVDESQSAFLPGKVIHDNILIAHELIRGYERKHISPRCAIQMDLQKAYDTVEWRALEEIMREMGFPRQFIR